MKLFELITLRRDCAAVQVPSGDAITLPAGTQVRVTQHLGGSYTVLTHGYMARIADRDAEAKIRGLPGVKEVDVEVVMDPPWDHSRMSEAAKLQLGLFDY